jgi:DNA-3-methyladenine glycosylase I
VPKTDARALFEKLVLEGFQAGLAWITILRNREAFRAAFDNFDVKTMAGYAEKGRKPAQGRRDRPPHAKAERL